MKTMMPGASIVLLLGLTALTQIVSADDKLHKYIVKPTAMSPDDAKKSHAAEYIKFKEKYQEMVVKADEARIEVEKAQKEFDEWTAKLNHGAVVDQTIQVAQMTVDVTTILQTKIKEVLPKVDKAANMSDEDWETLKKDLVAEALKEPKDVNQIVWQQAHQMIEDNVTDELKDKKTVKEALVKYQKEVDTELSKAKATLEKEKKFKTEYYEKYGKFEKEAEQVNWDTTDADAIKKLKGWAIDVQKAKANLDKKQAAQTKAEQAGRYQTKDAKDVMVDDVPEAGGMAYWQTKMADEHAKMVQNTDHDMAEKDDVVNGYKVLGFHNDVHGTNLLISSELELEDLKPFFQHTVDATDGHAEETHVWATLEQDDKAVPSVTIDSYLKIQNDAVARNNHMGTITRLELIVEAVESSRPRMENKAAADAKKEDWQPKQVTTKKDGKDVKKNDEEPVTKCYLNLQQLHVRVYDKSVAGKRWSNADLVRQSKDFEVLGDMTDLSQAKATIPGQGGEGKDGGSKTWMIVAIIFIVIVVLGGLVLGYQAYNASGSLQNTDI